MNALRAFPAEQQAGPHRARSSPIRHALTFRELTPADIHPVAINILNTKRDGQLPDPVADRRPAGAARQRHLRPRVPAAAGDPDRARAAGPAFGSVQHRIGDVEPDARHARRARCRTSRRRSAGPTRRRRRRSARRRRWLGGVIEHAHLRLAAAARSQRRLLRPAEHAHLEAPRHPQLDARHLQPARARDRRPGRADADDRHQHAAQLRRHRQRLGLLGHPARAGARPTAGRSSPAGTRCRRASSTAASSSTGEYMARTNGDLDYDNWVFFFTGHGAVRRRLRSRSGRHAARLPRPGRRRVRAGRLAARRRPHRQRRPALRRLRQLHRAQRPHRQLLPARCRGGSWASQPGFQVPGNAPFFQPGLHAAADRALRRSGHADRPEPDSRREVRLDAAAATTTTSRRASASRGSRRSRRRSSSAAAGASTTSAPAPATSATCSSSAPYFFYQNVPSPLEHGRPVSAAQRQPVPDSAATSGSSATPTARRAGSRRDGTPFPATSPFSAKSNTFIDPLLRDAVPAAVDDQRAVRGAAAACCSTSRYVGSRGAGPARQDQPRGAGRSAGDAGQRLHRHLRPARAR